MLIRKKKEVKINYINSEDKMVGLRKFVKGESTPIFLDFAIGYVVETSYDEDYPLFVDKISDKKTILPYKVFEDLKKAREALKTGELKYGEVYCYSVHDINRLFPEILKLHTKKEVWDYLINYNEAKNTCLNWTFMDEEEKVELKKQQNRKYII